MKKHEDNAAKGDLFTTGAEEFDQIKEETSSAKGRVIDLVLPVVVLIISAIGAMIFTGFQGGATGVVDAFAGCDAETSLIFATMLTIIDVYKRQALASGWAALTNTWGWAWKSGVNSRWFSLSSFCNTF